MSLLQDAPKNGPVSVLTEHVKLAEEACASTIKDLEAFKQRLAVEREKGSARTRAAQRAASAAKSEEAKGEEAKLEDAEAQLALSIDALRVLVHLANTPAVAHRDVGTVARELKMVRLVLQGHLDLLQKEGLAESEHARHRLGHLYWAPTPQGQQYIADRKL
jgi:DNA-binding MarR family transcriptional regulator